MGRRRGRMGRRETLADAATERVSAREEGVMERQEPAVAVFGSEFEREVAEVVLAFAQACAAASANDDAGNLL